MNFSGLESNFYLVNNPIYLTVTDINSNSPYLDYFISIYDENGNFTQTSKPQRAYNLSDRISVDIAPLLKSFMLEPSHNTNYTNLTDFAFKNNHIKARITVREYIKRTYFEDNPDSEIDNTVVVTEVNKTKTINNKTFLRGGQRTYESNINISNATNLTVSDSLPVWGGYPADYYYADYETGVKKSNVIPGSLKEERPVKGCDPIYVKFLNSLGGYSYWMFENSETEERSSNLGSIRRQSDVLDLGNNVEYSLTLISKVPKRYINLMNDLIVSPEIYRYYQDSQTWERLSSENNRITTNPFEVNNKVKLKFTPYSRYNPALIW